ncbi:MAG: thioredoxin family protein [Thermoguttaceae bacterium]
MHAKSGALSLALALCLTTGACLGASAISWQPSLERAQILAAHSNRLVLVHFWGNGCPPCEWMEREVFTRPDVAQALDRGFVAVKINKDQSPGDASQFGVAAVPTDVIITPQGQVVGSFVGRATAAEFVDRLNQVAQRFMPANAGMYADGSRGPAGPAAYSPLTLPTSSQPGTPGPGYPAGAPTVGMNPAAQQPVADPALVAQAIPQYSQQYGMGPNPAGPYGPNLASSQPGGNPAWDAASPMGVSPPNPGAYAANSQTPPDMGSYAADSQLPSAPGGPQQAPFGQQPPVQSMTGDPLGGNPPLGLDGFCPVSLEKTMRLDPQPKWMPGDARWGLRHEGRTYLFAGPAEQQAFFDNPNFYAPVLSGNDAVLQVEQGRPVPGAREFGARWRDRVYLFSTRESFEKFQSNPAFYENQILGSQQAAAGPAPSPSQNSDLGAAMGPAYGYR